MHANNGRSSGLYPSYICGTYGRLGANNPTGCHAHRVQHLVLERIVRAYLTETAPKVAQLLEATDTGDLEAAKPLLDRLLDTRFSEGKAGSDIMDFVAKIGDRKEVSRLVKQRKGIEEIYGVIYERMRPEWEAEIKEKETALDKMLEDYRGLSPTLRERLNKKMEALQAEIVTLKGRLADLRTPWANLRGELVAREKAVNNAVKALGKESNGRQKTETLRSVIKEVRCTFRHSINKPTTVSGKPNMGKSYLETVEIVPIAGESVCFTDGTMPWRG
jgi:hypothetical protein